MNDHLTTEARGWIFDCFEDAPADLTISEVWHAIKCHYLGGVAAFVAAAPSLPRPAETDKPIQSLRRLPHWQAR